MAPSEERGKPSRAAVDMADAEGIDVADVVAEAERLRRASIRAAGDGSVSADELAGAAERLVVYDVDVEPPLPVRCARLLCAIA